MKTALFAGTFDPPTLGHIEIIQRAGGLFDKVYVAILENSAKNRSPFTPDERKALLEKVLSKNKNVAVIVFSGLLVDCAKKLKADVLVRGLRNGTDFDYEYQMASTNKMLTGIETIFLASSPQFAHISANLIRDIARCGRRLHGLVPESIEDIIYNKFLG